MQIDLQSGQHAEITLFLLIPDHIAACPWLVHCRCNVTTPGHQAPTRWTSSYIRTRRTSNSRCLLKRRPCHQAPGKGIFRPPRWGIWVIPLIAGQMPVAFVSPRLNWWLCLCTKREGFLLAQGAYPSSSVEALIYFAQIVSSRCPAPRGGLRLPSSLAGSFRGTGGQWGLHPRTSSCAPVWPTASAYGFFASEKSKPLTLNGS